MQLTLTDLGHHFPQQPWLFRHLDLQMVPGEVYALTGPSGSGKSTLLSLLAGWVSPVEGTVSRDGVDSVQWVFQSPHGVARRTAVDHVALPFLAQGRPGAEARDRALELLERFKLPHRADAEYRELSGGEAQRLMLARAVAADAHLLLVDEPTAQLDPLTSQSVARSITDLADASTIVVVATHDAPTRDACSQHVDLGNWSVAA